MLVTLLDRLELLGICFNYLDFEESLNIIKEVKEIEKVLKYMKVKSYESRLDLDIIQLITKYNKKEILIKCFRAITDNELKSLAGVHVIDLSYCNLISDTGLKYLSGTATHAINLSKCHLVTDNGLKHLFGIAIHAIDLSFCGLVTDNGLKYLSGTAIHTINLSECHLVTDNGLKYLSGTAIHTKNHPVRFFVGLISSIAN
jgi:hypothetical protein